MAEPTKQELQALAWAVASWARCLPPMTRDRHQSPDVAAMHDKVRAARAGLKKLRAASGVSASDGKTKAGAAPASGDPA